LRVFNPSAVAGKTLGEFDSIDYIDGLPGLVAHPQPTVVPHGALLLVSGWTVDPVTNGPPRAVCILLDRAIPLQARTGIARGDIMLKHNTDEFVGYQLVISTSQLGIGPHELRAHALSADGHWYESALAGFRLYRHHLAVNVIGTLTHTIRMSLEVPRDLATGLPIPLGTPIHADRWVALRGWTFDERLGTGANTIVASDESGRTWSGPANIEDPVARELLSARDVRLGFEIVIPAAVFGRGRRQLHLTALDASGRQYPNRIEVAFDVIAAERPFPLTARISRSPLPFAARLRHGGDTQTEVPLPASDPITVLSRDELVIEGWALDENAVAADEVFIELTPMWLDLPSRRRAAASARERPVEGLPTAPVDNAWFHIAFNMPAVPDAVYALALVVVQPGRRSYSRVPLATLLIAS
jgi:hypothetical protein